MRPLGEEKKKKAMCHSFRKPCEQTVTIYHAMAVLEGTVLLVTKQAECLKKD